MVRILTHFIKLAYILLVLLGVVKFNLWSQVEYLHSADVPFSDLLLHPHLSRYLLVLPLYILSGYLSVSADYLFSVCVVVLILLTLKLMLRVYEIIVGNEQRDTANLVMVVGLLSLSLAMHGRIVFALLGMSLMIYSYVCLQYKVWDSMFKPLFFMITALWLASVSSGTFVVVYALLGLMFFEACVELMLGEKEAVKQWVIRFETIIILAFTLPFLFMAMNKNMEYYGGFWQMLQHGAGKFVLGMPTDILWLMFLLAILFVVFLFMVWYKTRKFSALFFGVLISLVGGGFGFSTMAVGIVPLLIYLSVIVA